VTELPADPVALRDHLRTTSEAQAASVHAELEAHPGVTTHIAAWLLGAILEPPLPDAAVVAQRLAHVTPRSVCPPLHAVSDRVELLHALVAAALSFTDSAGAIHPPWRDRLRDTLWDARARPGAFRDLSEHAVVLQTALDLPDSHPAGAVLQAISSAAVLAPPPETQARAREVILRARRRDLLNAWHAWTETSHLGPLHDALTAVREGEVPAAADDGPPDAVARALIGEAFGGELAVAVMPDTVLVTWTGEGEPPDAVWQGAVGLTPVEPAGSIAWRVWRAAPPETKVLDFVVARGDQQIRLPWPA
jgi:hypothetical protein